MSGALPEFGDDDTGQIATAIQKARTDPAAAAAETLPRLVAHEIDDRRWRRWMLGAAGLTVSVALSVGGFALHAAADASADRARIEDVQARLVRIEQQMDRLLERTDR